MSFTRSFTNIVAMGTVACLLAFSGSGFAATPSAMPQGKDHGSTRPVPPPEPVVAAPAFEVDVLVQAAYKPLAGQSVLARHSGKTVQTQTTGDDGMAHFLFGEPGKYRFSAEGANGTAHRSFTVKASTPPAPQTLTLKLKPQPAS